MRLWERLTKFVVLFGTFALSAYFAHHLSRGGLWRGLEPALAVTVNQGAKGPYDLTRLEAVNETLKTIRDKYVDPDARAAAGDAPLGAQLRAARRGAGHRPPRRGRPTRSPSASKRTRRSSASTTCRAPGTCRPACARSSGSCRTTCRGTEVDLREVEYAACNGMLHTLDPHSVFLSPEAYKEMNLSDLRRVRRARHRHLDPRSDAHRHEPHAGHARGPRGAHAARPHHQDQQRVDAQHAARRRREAPARRARHQGHRLGAPRRARRGAWMEGSKPFELVRERIKVKSVEARLLEGDVGYVRLKQFQSARRTRSTRRSPTSAEGPQPQGRRPRPARQPRRSARSGRARSPTSDSRRRARRHRRHVGRAAKRSSRTPRAPSRTTRWSCW